MRSTYQTYWDVKPFTFNVSAHLLWPGSVALVSKNPLGFQALARDDHTQANPSSLQITFIFSFFSAPPNTFTSIGQLWVKRHSYFLHVKQLLCKQSYNVTSTLLLITALTIITDKFLIMKPHRKRSCPNSVKRSNSIRLMSEDSFTSLRSFDLVFAGQGCENIKAACS